MRTAAKSRLALLLGVVALVVPATADAAFAPKLSVQLDPTERGAAPALTTRITQGGSESAARSVTLVFPTGFLTNTDVQLGSCTAAEENARACSPGSRIGSAEALAGGVQLSGPVHISTEGGQFRVIVFLDGLGGLVQQKLVGRVEFGTGGQLKTVFDNLPNTTTTLVEIRFLGGADKSLIRNPLDCGEFVFRGAFTSHAGEEALSEAPVTISGCPSKPALSAGSVRPRSVREGGTVTVRWSLSEATKGTRLIIERRSRGKWRRVASIVGTGNAGVNTKRIRLRGMRPGSYRVALRATNASGVASNALRIPFTIRPRR